MHVINSHIGRHSNEHNYLKHAAAILMRLGVFHLLFSLIGISMIIISPTISLVGGAGFQAILFAYVILQVCLGWGLGLLTIQAGRYCLQTHSWHFVFRVIVLNWFFFPIGTTVGFLIWRDLRHKGIRHFFDDA
jgi:hypothetical protein